MNTYLVTMIAEFVLCCLTFAFAHDFVDCMKGRGDVTILTLDADPDPALIGENENVRSYFLTKISFLTYFIQI